MSKGRAMRVLAMSGMGGEDEKSRYKGNGREMDDYNRGRYGGERMRGGEGRYDHGQHGGMNDEDWSERRRGRQGRHMSGEEYDEDNYEGGRGGYAGRFRHSQNPGKHEAGEDDDDEDEVEFGEHAAKKWVAGMRNNDGTTGEHFKPEIADQLRTTLCPGCDKTEFWAAMNMVYSDYCDVFKKLNVDRPETYAHMAKAFLMDKDAGEGKLAKYMKYVAGK